MEKAIVKRVIGPVVDILFPVGKIPELYHAIEVPLENRSVMLEVVQQLGNGEARCIALSSTDGISRGCEAIDTGAPITMPVGEATLGRMFNVAGEPIDGKGPVRAEKYLPIHRKAPHFTALTEKMFAVCPVCMESSFLWCSGSHTIVCWSSEPEASKL